MNLKRPSYAQVPDLGVSHQTAKVMGQSQLLSGSASGSDVVADDRTTAPALDSGRVDSGSPHSPEPHMSGDQSMDFNVPVRYFKVLF